MDDIILEIEDDRFPSGDDLFFDFYSLSTRMIEEGAHPGEVIFAMIAALEHIQSLPRESFN